jgi:maltose O-acetyltransferase
MKIRYFLAYRFVKRCGQNVNFEKGASFGLDFEIGDNSGVGINAQISDGVIIGNNVLMAPEVVILTSNHLFNRTDIPMKRRGGAKREEVKIEDDVWIGQRVIILPGVTVKKVTIVGAGAWITKTHPEFSIIGGNPARFLKMRI